MPPHPFDPHPFAASFPLRVAIVDVEEDLDKVVIRVANGMGPAALVGPVLDAPAAPPDEGRAPRHHAGCVAVILSAADFGRLMLRPDPPPPPPEAPPAD